ncbi:zinc finger protein 646 [Carettochelys insculpta]|uniref:zinc finger protein 646 n=1 Tax=Carettochelys insculpta TaxID=44489 RepID=UPI003EB98F21
MEEPSCDPSQPQREERPFKCGQCQRSYRHAGSLVNHRRTHEVGLFTCLLCRKEFSNPMALKNHLRIHTEERRHRCSDCGRSFRVASQLASHHRSAHARWGLQGEAEEENSFQHGQDSSSSDADVFPALEGGGAGTLLSNLEKYIAESVVPADFSQLEFPGKAEEGQEAPGVPAEERRYKCNQCDKAYKHAGSLTNHKQSHTLGVYQCAVCFKEFSNLMALKNHTRLHSEYRPYKCPSCCKAFRLPSELLSHQKVHDKDRWAGRARSEGSEHSVSEEDSIETSAKLDIYQLPPAAFGEGAPCSLKDGAKARGGDRGNPDGELCVRCGANFADEEELRNHSCLYPEEEEEEKEDGGGLAQPPMDSEGAWEASSKDGEQARPYRCRECGRTYRHAGSLINHKKSHQTGVYSCSVCCKQLFNLAALKNHLRIHLKSKPASRPGLRYSCPPAPEETTCHLNQGPSEPASRARAVEEGGALKEEETGGVEEEEEGATEERPYRCGECGRTYRHRGSLVNHRHTHKTGVYQCSLCPKQYSNLMALRNHARMHFRAARARERETYTCTSCGESFEEEAEYQHHQLRHAPADAATRPEEGKEEQEEPGTVRTQETALLQAVKRDAEELEEVGPAPGTSHICGCCGMLFRDVASLQSHTLTHSGGEPGTGECEAEPLGRRVYTCELCGKSYRHSGSLINHKQTHQMGDFECSLCAKRFSNLAALKSHLRGHQKLRKSQVGAEEEEGGVAEPADAPNGPVQSEGSEEAGGGSPESPGEGEERKLGEEQPKQSYSLRGGSMANGWQHPKDEEEPVEPLPSSPNSEPYQCESLNHKPSLQLGIYQCSLCPKEFPDVEALKSHFRGHAMAQRPGAEERPFLCSFCGMIFPGETDLRHHHGLAHSEEGEPRDGGLDGGEATAFPELRQEAEGRPDEPGGEDEMLLSHICGYCGQTFDDMASLETHSLGHREEKEAALADTTLQLRLGPQPEVPEEQKSSLKSPDRRPYTCGQCGKTYRHGGSLVNHKKTHQVGDYQCGVCSRQYPNLSAYRNHLRNHPKCKLNGSRPASNGKEPVVPPSGKEGETAAAPVPGKEAPAGGNAVDCQLHVCEVCGELCQGAAGLEAHCAAQHAPEEELVSIAKEDEEGGGGGPGEEGAASERPFCCEQCGRSYKHAGSLINHKQTHKTGLFRCTICQKLFYNLMALKNHNRIHFEAKRYKCTQCPKAFRLQKQLASHQRVHRDRKPTLPSSSSSRKLAPAKKAGKACADGGQVSVSPAAPRKHPDPEERPYRCEQCGRTYRHAGSLLNHRKSHKMGHYCCPVCPRAYPNLMALKNHQRIHFDVKRHRCPDCGKAFKWQRQLARHQLVHAQRRPRPGSRSSLGHRLGEGGAPVVGKTARGWRAPHREQGGSHVDASGGHVDGGHLSTTSGGHAEGTSGSDVDSSHVGSASVNASGGHVDGASGGHVDNTSVGISGGHVDTGTQTPGGDISTPLGPFQCPVCPKQFPNPSSLKNHGRVHTKKRFECSECGKAYRASRDLLQHLWRHQAEAEALATPGANGLVDRRPYKCDRCERTYRHAGSLLHHKKVHTVGLYRCPACLKEFHNLLALTYHHRTHSDKKRCRCQDCGQAFRTSSRLASHAKACPGRTKASHPAPGGDQGPGTGSSQNWGLDGDAALATGPVS